MRFCCHLLHLRRLNPRRVFQTPILNLDFPNPKLLNLPRHRHRKRLHESNILRHLEVCDPTPAELPDLLLCRRLFQPDPSRNRLAESYIGEPHHLHFRNLRMRVQKLFDLSRLDIFTGPYDHVLPSPRNPEAFVNIDCRQIPGVQPSVLVDRPASRF